MNVPGIVGTTVSSRLATLHELQTVYGLKDAYDLHEIVLVNAHNQREMNKRNRPRGS